MQPNFPSRTVFLGDNLDFLRGMNSECVDLIYADPPFNKKKEFTAPIGSQAEGAGFLDYFTEADVKDEWGESIRQENFELHSMLRGVKAMGDTYTYCYLVYIAIRIVECHRILKGTGSFYLHCDHTMSHYLKLLLDCIFGEKQFRNEIVWGYAKPRPAKKMFVRNHDIILFYARSAAAKFNPQRMPTIKGEFVMRAPFRRPDGKVWQPKEAGVLAGSWWHDIPSFSTRMTAKERTGWPTQKPLKLMERIIAASSNPGDLVLDPFCGCVTTCIAAEKLGRDWVGIDIAKESWNLIEDRLKKEVPADLLRGEPNCSQVHPKRGAEDARPKKYVYVISNPAYPGIYKVGVAADAKARLKQYQTADPNRGYQLEFALRSAEYAALEPAIHRRFNGDHEWVPGELSEIIAAIKKWRPAQAKMV